MPKAKKSVRAQVGLRLRESLRSRIEKAARNRDVSMNTEIMERLHQSFDFEGRLGGPQVTLVVETIAAAMRSSGRMAGFMATRQVSKEDEWLTIPYAYDQAVKAAITVLEAHRPEGEIKVPRPAVHEVVGGDPMESEELLRHLIAELGPLMAEKEIKSRRQKK